MLIRMSQHCKSMMLVVSLILLSVTVSFSQLTIPEAYLGRWSTNCVGEKKANDEAHMPVAFSLEKDSKGYWAHYAGARTAGSVYHVEEIENGIVVFYKDEAGGSGNQVVIMKLNNDVLSITSSWISELFFRRCPK